MTDKEKLDALFEYTLDAERYWRKRAKDGFDKYVCAYHLMAIQDILQFAEMELGMPYKQLPLN